MRIALGFVILMFSESGVIDGFPSSPSIDRKQTKSSNETTDCGDDEYHDIRTLTVLKFSATRRAWRKRHFIADNTQLQCQDPNTCSYSGYPAEATCFNGNSGKNKFSGPHWQCETSFPDRRYTFGNTRVSCEILSEVKEYCVLRDSCILLYNPSKEASLLLGFALTTISMASFFCLLAILCSIRRHRLESSLVSSLQNRTCPDRDSYNPANDLPPSYNFVQRNPERFEKPSMKIQEPPPLKEQPLSESPPPAYETCSGDEN